MGIMQRRKGSHNERLVVKHLQNKGYKAIRIPLSGATLYAKGDVEVEFNNKTLVLEVKVRAQGFTKLYKKLLKEGRVWEKNKKHTLYASFEFEDAAFGQLRYLGVPESLGLNIRGYEKLKGPSDLLVVKADYRPFIFIRIDENPLPVS